MNAVIMCFDPNEKQSVICERKLVIDSSQRTSTITCAVAPRVWHFSAFHSFWKSPLQLGGSARCSNLKVYCLEGPFLYIP